jgi:GNAT superfamily N-acetyltransferase
MSPETFDLRMDWRGRPVERWTLAMHLNGNRHPAAWATFAGGPAIDWHVVELFVSVLYRGTGLNEELIHQANAILLRDRAKDRNEVWEDNATASCSSGL